MTGVTRRRFLAVSACGAAFSGLGPANAQAARTWRGVALGAAASITLHNADADQADELIASAVTEISRLEALFSLYRPDSAIAKLNRQGRLDNPDPEFLTVLSLSDAVFRATEGAFDPTVQGLWADLATLHANRVPESEEVLAVCQQAGNKIGFGLVDRRTDRVALLRSNMALTLNGIAQGYITDRITDLLRNSGMKSVLVHLGETRAVGRRQDGTPWRVGINSSALPGRIVRTLQLQDRAVATSAATGTTFDADRMVSHILDPRGLVPARPHRQVSVEAPTAVLADALSTAACLMTDMQARESIGQFDDCRIVYTA